MRTIAALAALLLSAGAWAQDAEEPAEAVKVLGFTFGEPPPEDAVLVVAAGKYGRYALEHRWCQVLYAVTDNGRVVAVRCYAKYLDTMMSLLKSRYGAPDRYSRNADRWLTPNGLGILLELTHGPLAVSPCLVTWLRAATLDEFDGVTS